MSICVHSYSSAFGRYDLVILPSHLQVFMALTCADDDAEALPVGKTLYCTFLPCALHVSCLMYGVFLSERLAGYIQCLYFFCGSFSFTPGKASKKSRLCAG